jgi:hydrogenase maturation protein HypF
MENELERRRVIINGLVQGVGFRPFLFNLAREHGLTGWVRNNFAGVELEIQGSARALDGFGAALVSRAPSAARIETVLSEPVPAAPAESGFQIIPSASGTVQGSPLPDQGICAACSAEFFDPSDRRWHHPFNSCTLCGPRFTVIDSLPFDRSRTSMAEFPLCPECEREYTDPSNRRFHAQTIACPDCGPILRFTDPAGNEMTGNPAAAAREVLRTGGILGIKGIGGYHLACDARNEAAVLRLRQLKGRDNRAFAVMFRDLNAAREECELAPAEAELLADPVRPILLAVQKSGGQLAPGVNPGLREVGVFLPYTGIQLLLFAAELPALVMTSGNRSGEPLSIEDAEAYRDLGPLVDGFLVHNRRILWRCDDSVLRYQAGRIIGIRRSRGYAPAPLNVGRSLPPLLACGPQQKNTFALTLGERIFLSPHQGDLDNLNTFLAYRETIGRFQRLLQCRPEWAVHDLHPDYASTRYARETGLPLIGIQHHLAHVAGAVALAGWEGPVLGVSLDGSGYGPDGTIWGGEFFIGEGCRWRRAGHLSYYPLPGGEAAIHEPWRMAASYLFKNQPGRLAEWLDAAGLTERWRILGTAVRAGINAPETSSMGRLFDGVASLLGRITQVTYEGEAAIWLENQADPAVAGCYPVDLMERDGRIIFDPGPLAAAVVADIGEIGTGAISMKFHRTIAALIVAVAIRLRHEAGSNQIVLSGGVFQNRLLVDLTVETLERSGFEVFLPEVVPVNDGGIAFGQAWLAGLMIEGGCTDVFGGSR